HLDLIRNLADFQLHVYDHALAHCEMDSTPADGLESRQRSLYLVVAGLEQRREISPSLIGDEVEACSRLGILDNDARTRKNRSSCVTDGSLYSGSNRLAKGYAG